MKTGIVGTAGEPVNLKGHAFGKWTVLHRSSSKANRPRRWYCMCECGKEGSVSERLLLSGQSTACFACNQPAEPHYSPVTQLAARVLKELGATLDDSLAGELELMRVRRELRKTLPLHSAEQLETAIMRAAGRVI
jgi:hypothetical protein